MTRASPKLDFETVSLYTLPILVRDNKGSSASQTIFIQIADVNEPPVFTGALAQPGQGMKDLCFYGGISGGFLKVSFSSCQGDEWDWGNSVCIGTHLQLRTRSPPLQAQGMGWN